MQICAGDASFALGTWGNHHRDMNQVSKSALDVSDLETLVQFFELLDAIATREGIND